MIFAFLWLTSPNMTICNRSLLLSCVWLFVTPWTAGCESPLSVEFPRQEYWSGFPFPYAGEQSTITPIKWSLCARHRFHVLTHLIFPKYYSFNKWRNWGKEKLIFPESSLQQNFSKNYNSSPLLRKHLVNTTSILWSQITEDLRD